MILLDGALVRSQNHMDVDDSCFDTSELKHMLDKIVKKDPDLLKIHEDIRLDQFIVDGVLQRHPYTKFPNDISSDQAHMYFLPTGRAFVKDGKTSNGDLVSLGFKAAYSQQTWLSSLLLIGQIILFWIPVRWCDGNNPTVRFGPIKLNIGYRHHCGDYRLFKQCLFYAPWWIRRLVRKSTLKKMTRYYWEPEPSIEWIIRIDDQFVEECL